jgi:hypothetical protein
MIFNDLQWLEFVLTNYMSFTQKTTKLKKKRSSVMFKLYNKAGALAWTFKKYNAWPFLKVQTY